MARTSNTVPPEIASKLADVARRLRGHIYGEQACPEWGTRFTQLEDQGMQVGLELARLFMQQSDQHQADLATLCKPYSTLKITARPAFVDEPIFWKERAKNRTGLRRCVGIRKTVEQPSAT